MNQSSGKHTREAEELVPLPEEPASLKQRVSIEEILPARLQKLSEEVTRGVQQLQLEEQGGSTQLVVEGEISNLERELELRRKQRVSELKRAKISNGELFGNLFKFLRSKSDEQCQGDDAEVASKLKNAKVSGDSEPPGPFTQVRTFFKKQFAHALAQWQPLQKFTSDSAILRQITHTYDESEEKLSLDQLKFFCRLARTLSAFFGESGYCTVTLERIKSARRQVTCCPPAAAVPWPKFDKSHGPAQNQGPVVGYLIERAKKQMEFGGYFFHQKCHAGVESISLEGSVKGYIDSYLVHPAPTCENIESGLDVPEIQEMVLEAAAKRWPRIRKMFDEAAKELSDAKIKNLKCVKCPVLIRTCAFLGEALSDMTIDPVSLAQVDTVEQLNAVQEFQARRITEALEAHRLNGRIKKFQGDKEGHRGYLLLCDPVWTAMCTGGATTSAMSGYMASIGWPTRWDVNLVNKDHYYAVDLDWTPSESAAAKSPICTVVLDPNHQSMLKSRKWLQQSLSKKMNRVIVSVQTGSPNFRRSVTFAVGRLVYSAVFPKCVPALTIDHLTGRIHNNRIEYLTNSPKGENLNRMIKFRDTIYCDMEVDDDPCTEDCAEAELEPT